MLRDVAILFAESRLHSLAQYLYRTFHTSQIASTSSGVSVNIGGKGVIDWRSGADWATGLRYLKRGASYGTRPHIVNLERKGDRRLCEWSRQEIRERGPKFRYFSPRRGVRFVRSNIGSASIMLARENMAWNHAMHTMFCSKPRNFGNWERESLCALSRKAT